MGNIGKKQSLKLHSLYIPVLGTRTIHAAWRRGADWDVASPSSHSKNQVRVSQKSSWWHKWLEHSLSQAPCKGISLTGRSLTCRLKKENCSMNCVERPNWPMQYTYFDSAEFWSFAPLWLTFLWFITYLVKDYTGVRPTRSVNPCSYVLSRGHASHRLLETIFCLLKFNNKPSNTNYKIFSCPLN